MSTETKTPIEFWAIIELFGHNTIAGYVTEQSIGGGSFIRVDVPAADEDHPAFTKFYGDKAIYAITPCSEEVAQVAVKRLRVRPVSPFTVPPTSLASNQLVDSLGEEIKEGNERNFDDDYDEDDGNDDDSWKRF